MSKLESIWIHTCDTKLMGSLQNLVISLCASCCSRGWIKDFLFHNRAATSGRFFHLWGRWCHAKLFHFLPYYYLHFFFLFLNRTFDETSDWAIYGLHSRTWMNVGSLNDGSGWMLRVLAWNVRATDSFAWGTTPPRDYANLLTSFA